MEDNDLKSAIQRVLAEAEVGKKIVLDFTGTPQLIDIELTFMGGWTVSQRIVPGRPFELIRGVDGYLTDVKISIHPYDGPAAAQ